MPSDIHASSSQRATSKQAGLIGVNDRGLLLGDGVFDTAMAIAGRIVHHKAHIERLADACAALGIEANSGQLTKMTASAARKIGNGTVRLTVTRGPGPRGVSPKGCTNPTLFTSFAAGLGTSFRSRRLVRTEIRRNETSPTSRYKTLNYLDAVIAVRSAQAAGFDDALFLNTADRVACTSTGNLFLIKGARLSTPALGEGVLPGIIRARLLELALRVGLQVEERPVAAAELDSCEGIFVSNSLLMISPVTALAGRLRPLSGYEAMSRLASALIDDIVAEAGSQARNILKPEIMPK